MSETAEAPRGGALSLEEAVALVDRREDAGGEGPEAGGREDPDDEFDGAASAPEEAPDRAEDPDGEAEEAEAQDPGEVDRLEAPRYWSKDAKARFAELDPELQAVVLAQEGPREEAAAKAKAEARQVREAAEQEVAEVRRFAAELSQFLPQALEQLDARWGGPAPDWAEFARQHGVEAMSYAKAQHEAEQEQLHRLAQAAADSEARAHQAYVRAEFDRLKSLDPELADPASGADRRTEVTRYLHGFGVAPDALFRISALEMSLARKAMLWDQAQAKAGKSNASPRAAPAATRPLARGGASSGAVDPKARKAAQARTRFAKSRSIEDAVALLNAQGD